MLTFPDFDPVALSLGPVKVHWYGIMYLLAFTAAWLIAMHQAKKKNSAIKKDQIEDLILFGALGVVVGGRIGYVFFYQFESFLNDPLWLFRVWEGGMSFHGGFVGVVFSMWFYARKIKVSFLSLLDFIAPLVPLGLGFGRVGNFIGQELWGRATDFPWGMKFPREGAEAIARHPSQLYEAALEGLLLFVILYWFSSRTRPIGSICGLGIFLYGCFRILVEFTREPDVHIQFDLFGWVTRGQILSLPMVLIGFGLFVWAYNKSRSEFIRY
ncbi:MAG: prolipoprotein diacylglyceryl transferase [Cellvibrionaceae bacterium]